MSLESRVDKLEEHHKQMDENLHSLAKTCADIKTIALTNQHDIAGLTSCVKTLAEATHAGFKRVDERHDEFLKEVRERFNNLEREQAETRQDIARLELLIRQSLPSN